MTSEILSFYSKTNVLVTGGTGLLGSLLIEKLLRVCDDLEGIYLLIRPKKGKNITERLETIFKDVVFDKLREQEPEFVKKIYPLEGDISLKGLGLSETDRKLLINKTNIVFHCAAHLNMDSKLKHSVVSNIRGTDEVLDLCHEMFNLKSVVFVSTAYSNSPRPVIEERIYPTPVQASTLIKFTEEVDEKVIDDITPGLLGEWPNAYCFSKALTENLINDKRGDLPAGIFRPTMIMNTFSEPIPGWISNIYGPVGIMVAAGVGLLRVYYVRSHYRFDSVPADLCVNSLICSAWEVHKKWKESKEKNTDSDLPVYNYSAGPELSMTWDEFGAYGVAHEYPLKNRMWVVSMVLTSCIYYYNFLWIMLHSVPGIFIDGYLFLTGKKPRIMKTYKKIGKFVQVIHYFTNRQWNIINKNVYSLWDRLNEIDRKLFPFDMRTIDNAKYMSIVCLGIKLYIIKETLEDAEEVQASYKRQLKIHKAMKYTFRLVLIIILYKIFAALYIKFL